jgi:hypothetical protein
MWSIAGEEELTWTFGPTEMRAAVPVVAAAAVRVGRGAPVGLRVSQRSAAVMRARAGAGTVSRRGHAGRIGEAPA